MKETGYSAMGKPVPCNRLQNTYATVKEIAPELSTEKAMTIVNKCQQFVERDNPYAIVGATHGLDPDLAMIDLTGRYRLLAVLCTDSSETV
jgi:hypothetical protein